MGCALVARSFDRIVVLHVELGKEFAGIGGLRERNRTSGIIGRARNVHAKKLCGRTEIVELVMLGEL